MERIEKQNREEESNENIPRIVLDLYKKSKSKQVCDQQRGGEESTREI